MKRTALFVLLCAFIISCGDKDALPKGILPKPKMEAVLWDMIRTGEFLNGYVLYTDTAINRTQESLKWYDKIYAMHKITREQFEKSYAYYRSHPPVMRELLDSLSKKTDSTPAMRIDTTQSRRVDSIVKSKQAVLDTLRKRRDIDTLKNRRNVIKKRLIGAPQ